MQPLLYLAPRRHYPSHLFNLPRPVTFMQSVVGVGAFTAWGSQTAYNPFNPNANKCKGIRACFIHVHEDAYLIAV